MFNLVIVEDNVATLEVLSKRIPWESQGIYLIGTFADGTEAYDFCRLEKPDILLTDVEMYGMNGLELSDKLLALYPDLELVFISAYNDFSYVRGALRMGAYDYVLKPLDYGQVIKTVVKALGNLKKKRADTRVIKEQVLLNYLTRSFNPHDSSSPPFPAELPLPDMPACCMVFKWHDTRSRLLPNVDFTQTVRQYLRIILNGSKPLMTEIPGRMVIIILPLDRPNYPAPEELALMLRKRGLAQFREKLWVGIGLSKRALQERRWEDREMG